MSNYLINQYRQLHADGTYSNRPYPAGDREAFAILKSQISTISPLRRALDYGCGRCTMMEGLLWRAVEQVHYDPAIPEYSDKPTGTFDIVFCCDVMEHIPEDEVQATLAEIKGYGGTALFTIHLGLAGKILPDGQNAHCTVKPIQWWEEELLQQWDTIVHLMEWPRKIAFRCTTQT